MRRIILAIAAITLGTCIYLGVRIINEKEIVSTRINILKTEINNIRKRISTLDKFVSETPQSLKEDYSLLYNHLIRVASYTGTHCQVEIEGASEGVNIEEYFNESAISGIKTVKLEINFNKLNDFDSAEIVIEAIQQLHTKYPVEITKLTKSKDSLTVYLNLYGV